VNDRVWLTRQKIQGLLGRGIAWMIRVVVPASLVSGIVGLLLATKFYVLQEIFAGLITVAVLLAVGVLLVVISVTLREVCQYCRHWVMRARSAKAGRHNRDSHGGALFGVDSQ
jgi:xanthine/uracil permease